VVDVDARRGRDLDLVSFRCPFDVVIPSMFDAVGDRSPAVFGVVVTVDLERAGDGVGNPLPGLCSGGWWWLCRSR